MENKMLKRTTNKPLTRGTGLKRTTNKPLTRGTGLKTRKVA